jgi:hypothetical protein
MRTIDVQVRRLTIISSRPFNDVIERLASTIGHPNISAFHTALTEARTVAEIDEILQDAVGSSRLMEFARFDAGEVLRKEHGRQHPGIIRFIVGNPLIMMAMARSVPDAAAYAPVTILVQEGPDGVQLSYDSLESLVAPYGNQSALAVASDLDAEIVNLLTTAAR